MSLVDQFGQPIVAQTRAVDTVNVPPQGMPGVSRPGSGASTADSYANFLNSVGLGARNQSGGGTYDFNPITRERTLLEFMYRSSWVCGVAIDAVADDMTKMGIDYSGQVPPEEGEMLDAQLRGFQIWSKLNDLIKWGRLYGGCIAIILIDGQDPATPLRAETIGKDQFRGLLVLDRWQVEPSLNNLIQIGESNTEIGLPRFYRITSDSAVYPRASVHYSRVFRYEGYSLPYQQRLAENLWGMSVYERLYDRLLAFDSTTQGVAQLAFKAYLRSIKIKNLREMISTGGANLQRLLNQIEMMRLFQSNEGITLLDADDDFGTTTYAFSGLDSVLLQFGQQLCGALQIPGVRLFGQSPAGLNATGDSDWRNYYDGTHQQQENRLRMPLTTCLGVMAMSAGIKLPKEFNFTFRSLWQMTTKEKAEVAEINTRTVLAAEETGVISPRRALEELRQSSQETGIWTTITDEEVEQASEEMPPSPGELAAMPGQQPGEHPAGGPAPPGAQRRLPVSVPTVHLRSEQAA
jgi:phage-related protein (TIGR01555 family)